LSDVFHGRAFIGLVKSLPSLVRTRDSVPAEVSLCHAPDNIQVNVGHPDFEVWCFT
jgi:hypothetical protein